MPKSSSEFFATLFLLCLFVYHSFFFLLFSLTKLGCYAESTLQSTDRSRTSKQNFKYWGSLWLHLLLWSNKEWIPGRQTTEWKTMKDKGGKKHWKTTTKKEKDKTPKVRKQRSLAKLQTRKDINKKGDQTPRELTTWYDENLVCLFLLPAAVQTSLRIFFSKRVLTYKLHEKELLYPETAKPPKH